MLSLLVIIILLVILIFLVVAPYNALVRGRNEVKSAWSSIDVQLKRRYDLIPNLVETVKGYAGHERQTLDAVVQARQQAINFTAVRRNGPRSKTPLPPPCVHSLPLPRPIRISRPIRIFWPCRKNWPTRKTRSVSPANFTTMPPNDIRTGWRCFPATSLPTYSDSRPSLFLRFRTMQIAWPLR